MVTMAQKNFKNYEKTLAILRGTRYNKLIYAYRGIMPFFSCQFRELIPPVIEYTGWRKAVTNHALARNLAAETGISGNSKSGG